MGDEDQSVAHIQQTIAQMGFLISDQSVHDFGIEIEIETVSEQNSATGRKVALQLVHNMSSVKILAGGNLEYTPEKHHITYWAEHSLPVLLIISDPRREKAWWCDLKETISRNPDMLTSAAGTTLYVPASQVFTLNTRAILLNLANSHSDCLSLDADWYSLVALDNTSWLAERCRGEILVRHNVDKPGIRLAIYQANQNLLDRTGHRSSEQVRYWRGQQPHLIALFAYKDVDDMANLNWIARSSWRHPNHSTDNGIVHVIRWDTNDSTGDVFIDFRAESDYLARKSYFADNSTTAAECLRHICHWINQADMLVRRALDLTQGHQAQRIETTIYTAAMEKLAQEFSPVERAYDHSIIWPSECKAAANYFGGAIESAGNLFLPFSRIGKGKWDGKPLEWMISNSLERYCERRSWFEAEMTTVTS